MPNPLFDLMCRPAAPMQQTAGNAALMQRIADFAKTVPGSPEQLVRNLISSGRMTQQQFERLGSMANQILGRK